MSKTMQLEVCVGDYSCDGHGRTEQQIIDVVYDKELPLKQVTEHVFKSEQFIKDVLQIDISKWFNDYEDNQIKAADVEILRKLGMFKKGALPSVVMLEEPLSNGNLEIWAASDFIEIWMYLFNKALENKHIPIRVKTHNVASMVLTGGYGLFCD